MKFKPGQEVVCIKRDPWRSIIYRVPSIGPAFNEIVTVDYYNPERETCFFAVEYPRGSDGGRVAFFEDRFAPILPAESLSEMVEDAMLSPILSRKLNPNYQP